MEICSVCGRTYQYLSTLRMHLKRNHRFDKETVSSLVPRKKKDISTFKYPCTTCSIGYNDLRHYRYHIKKAHFESNQEIGYPVKCKLCSITTRNIAQHLKVEHDLKIDNLEFDSFNTFLQWKKKIEERTVCKFVMQRSRCFNRSGKHLKERLYICHRSGEFKPRGNGLRPLKIQGSKKINAYCPAAIRLKIFSDKCKAQFTETHIGHDNELCHMDLSSTKQEEMAKKLKKMVSDEVGKSVDGQLQRIHLLTTKDLHKLCRDFDTSSEEMKNIVDGVNPSNHPSESTNLIPLSVTETFLNSQHESELQATVIEEPSEENEDDVTVEYLQNDFNDLLLNSPTTDDRRILLLCLKKARLAIESKGIVNKTIVNKKEGEGNNKAEKAVLRKRKTENIKSQD